MRIQYFLGVVLLLALAVVMVACGGGGGGAQPTPTPKQASAATPTKAATGSPAKGEVVVIEQTENPYSFKPNTFTFQLGKTYALTFAAPKEFHTFTVTDLGIDIFINAGEKVVQDVTPNKAGTFKLLCTPHEGLGMVGNVTVQ